MSSTTISRGNILASLLIGLNITPTALTASTTTAETFPLLGAQVNDAVQASFNGAQTAGVGIANARISAVNTIEITFSNSTAGTPTPVAGIYTIALDRAENMPLPTTAL